VNSFFIDLPGKFLLATLTLAVGQFGVQANETPDDTPAQVRELRLQGKLEAAQSLAEKTIFETGISPGEAFDIRLELARIYDRFGLHFRSRPVLAALDEIDTATKLAADLGDVYEARAKLARANYYYRAEMSERKFPTAIQLLNESLRLFPVSNFHDRAEAVHLQGLIHLQMRELDLARELFDESLRLDIQGGARVFFLGEYERHVAFVFIFQDNPSEAIPHLERSLDARIEAGAIDASLFAANTLASQQLALGNLDAIPALLEYSESVLENLDSPYGEYQYLMINGRFRDEIKDHCQSSEIYRRAEIVAGSINWDAGLRQADEYQENAEQLAEDCT